MLCSSKIVVRISKRSVLVLLCLSAVFASAKCFASESLNPFQGTWVSGEDTVDVSKCTKSTCKIKIDTINGVYTCDLDGTLTVLSNTKAVFFISGYESELRKFPIDLTRSKHVITVSIPGESREAARGNCGMKAYFEGEYMNNKYPQTYKTSFNCEKAKTAIEHAVCHSADLAYEDTVLSRLYLNLKKKQFKNIVEKQRKWMSERNVCNNSSDINACLSDKYNEGILSLQQDFMTSVSGGSSAKNNLPYNSDYLFYMSKQSAQEQWEIPLDPPLQHYLSSILEKEKAEEELNRNYQINLNSEVDDSVLMITGVSPGISENALVLKKDHSLWFAYTSYAENFKSKVIIFCPKKLHFNRDAGAFKGLG